MKSKWKKCQLGDLITFQRGYDLPKTKMKYGIYPVVGSNGIIGYHNEYTTEAPSITIGRSGNVGKPFIYKGQSWSHNTTLYIKEFKNVDPIFVYYYLQLLNLANFAGGSAVPTLNRNHIHSLDICVPETINEQKKIAHILSILDDKIAINTAINKNLESQAQAIFKSWFVDFEPFGGEMPITWKYIPLGKIADISSGKRPPNKSEVMTEQENIPIIGASNIMGFTNIANHVDKILVIGRVGTHGIVQRFNSPCWTSDNTLVITSEYYEYVYQILSGIDYTALNRGSTQPLITQGDMKKFSVLLPDESTLEEYEQLAGTLMLQHEHNIIENTRLATLRDTLLPRLMSGEIDVGNVEV